MHVSFVTTPRRLVVRGSLLISPTGYSDVVAHIQRYVCTQTKKVWTHWLTLVPASIRQGAKVPIERERECASAVWSIWNDFEVRIALLSRLYPFSCHFSPRGWVVLGQAYTRDGAFVRVQARRWMETRTCIYVASRGCAAQHNDY